MRYTEELNVPDSLANAPDLVTIHTETYVSDKDDAGCRQKIGTSLALPNHPNVASKSMVILLCQWSEYSERMPQVDRLTAISADTRIPVLSLDMPGQSPNSSGLSRRQREALGKGDYTPLASALWNAAKFVAETRSIDLCDKEVILVGPSQGGPQAAAMAAIAPEGMVLSDVVLWNSPSVYNLPRRDSVGLASDFLLHGSKDMQYYSTLNPEWAYQESAKDGLRIVRHPISHGVTALRGMAHASDSTLLYNPLQSGDLEARIHIIHSSEDAVSLACSNQAAEEYLNRTRARGNIRRVELEGEYHAITNYIGAVAVAVKGVVDAKY